MRLPALKPAEVVRTLKRAGFEAGRQVGSHLSLINREQRRIVTVPMHHKDLKRGLLFGIIKDAGFTKEEFLALLR